MRSPSSLLLRKRTIIAASLSLIIFSATVSVLIGIGDIPKTMLGNEDVYLITSKGSYSVLSSRINSQLAEMLLENNFVTNASPEIFGFAKVKGDAVTLRGVDFGQFMNVENAILISGSLPSDPSHALIGKRLSERLAASVGDRIPLVGSFNPSVAEAEITGIIDTSSGVLDELIVSLPLARTISTVPQNQVSIIRVTGNVSFLDTVFAPDTPRFSIYDLSIPKMEIAVGSQLPVSLKVKNWGDANGTAHVMLRNEVENETLFDGDIDLDSGEIYEISVNHTFSIVGDHEFVAHLSGILPQTISTNVTVREPYLLIIAPEKVAQYNNFTVSVLDFLFNPVNNASVDVGGFATVVTNESGHCIVDSLLPLGFLTIVAGHPDFDDGSATIEVIDSSTLPQEVDTRVFKITLTPDIIKVRENSTVAIHCQNIGNASGSMSITVLMNGNYFTTRAMYLHPLEIRIFYYNLSFTTAGDRTFTSGAVSETLTVESLYQINPGLVQFLLQFGSEGSLDPSTGNLIYSTAKISEANILIVLVSLAILSATLVTLGVSSSFMKEINDNMKIIGILRSIGASSHQLLTMIFKQALLLSLPAAGIGLVGGLVLAYLISLSERLLAFGHVVAPVLDPTVILAAGLGCVAICIGSSLIAGLSVSRKVTIRMIRGTKDLSVEQPTLRELLGEE